jgi:glycine/D-amino acid oxidase-like deaminating enzyme
MKHQSYGAVIVGGGFYGSVVARESRKYFRRVLVLEKEEDLMQRASYRNQARVHQGYHYPRSLLTSLRSRINFSRFVEEYEQAVVSDFAKYYAIGKTFSKVTATQFRVFCERIGAPLRPAPREVKALFDSRHIEDVFQVEEYAFDSVKLKRVIESQLAELDIEYETGAFVESVRPTGEYCRVAFTQGGEGEEIEAQYVFNCAYSLINGILWRSGLPIIPMKHEYAEMPLIEVPAALRDKGITIMDGPYFATMPFPSKGLHSLHHVRYTPHHWWVDTPGAGYLDARRYFETEHPESQYGHMIKDAARYIPSLERSRFVESLWEIKTVLPRSEVDDSRPILFHPVEGVANFICILGGKIDNIYDIQNYLGEFLVARGVAS